MILTSYLGFVWKIKLINYNNGEVMTARDRLALRRQFATVGDIYQGVEGIPGITCAHGRLHLCEEKYLIEKGW